MQTSIEQKKYSYYLIDYFKVIFAVCVIAIHSHPINSVTNQAVNDLYNYIVSLAVPFFFCVSGMILSEKLQTKSYEEKYSYVKKIVRKYIKLYIQWCLAYLPLTIWGMIYNYTPNHTGILKALVSLIRGYLLLGEQFCSWPLWYLLSAIYGLLFLMVIIKFQKIDNLPFLLIIAIVFYIVAVVLNWINDTELQGVMGMAKLIVEKTIMGGRLLSGIRFLLLGIVFQKIKMKRAITWWWLGISCIVMVCLALIFHFEYSNVALAPMVVVPFLVKCFMYYRKSDCILFRLCRKFSQVAYHTHMYFLFMFWYDLTGFKMIRQQGAASFLVAFGGVVFILGLTVIINRMNTMIKIRREGN